MPFKIKNLSRFAGRAKRDSILPAPQMQSTPVPPSGILYRDCFKLPLDVFMDCLLDNDLSGLGPESEERDEIWDKIYIQHLEQSQSTGYNEAFELMKEINDYRAKITIANNCISHLQMQYDAEIVGVLNLFALQCRIEPEDIGDVLIKKLNGVVAKMKKWFPMMKKAQADLDALRKKDGAKVDRKYFDEALEAISNEKGYNVEASRITVSRFNAAVNKITEKALKQQVNANPKNR